MKCIRHIVTLKKERGEYEVEKSEQARVVVFGGGTGLSTVLRGLKQREVHITAIVTVADDGGSSGRLLQQFNIPPPGDIRQVMAALSTRGPIAEELFQYRFADEDGVPGHALGNLMLAALTDITGDFASAIDRLSELFHIKGRVLPAANERLTLHAELADGTIVTGESKIPMYRTDIEKVYVSPQEVKPLPEAVEAIQRADYILIGPGSLYTSILPSLLVRQIQEAVLQSDAKKVYISNLTTQNGETTSYTASEHVEALYNHIGSPFLDTIVLHTFQNAEEEQLIERRLKRQEMSLVEQDEERLHALGIVIKKEDIATWVDNRFIHDPIKLAHWLHTCMNHRR